MTVTVRRPGPPLAGLVTEIVYRTGEQSRTCVEKILPGPDTGLWVNLNRDAFRSFGEAGLTPKRFGRVQRLQRLVRGLDGQIRVDWAATAARYGYCDQAHLTGEFRELVGVTPAGYLRSRVNGPNHLRFDVRA